MALIAHVYYYAVDVPPGIAGFQPANQSQLEAGGPRNRVSPPSIME
jgi:hypothetical protein